MLNRPILCVDDDPSTLGLMREILQTDHRLVFALSGMGALQAVGKHSPALILLDVQMSDLSGFEVARRLKADPKTEPIPIIFVTSLADEVDEQAGFDSGGVDYITKPISPPIVRARVRTHLSLVRVAALEASHRAAISMLGEAGHYNDTDTGAHIWRMAAFSRLLAQAAGWSDEAASLLELAAPMHDTGKIGIPDAILKKPGRLTADEWVIMKTHSRIGYDILSKNDAPLFQLAAEIALRHHEKWDGSGYPDGLAGDDIPQSARIVAVADVFDALSMRRPYKEPWPLEHILIALDEGAGVHLEAKMVGIFKDILPKIQEVKAHWDAQERESRSGPAQLWRGGRGNAGRATMDAILARNPVSGAGDSVKK
ncbi:HD domain-containing phosphohydrolase [Telmatospirillum sp.]|uniref:response regulator n=1 Tax=Telmatospirillum sp. TaxID=2079197 RepID=UPI00283DEA59|nr:HD domain-containing phosphohydrolase [Telmatospirillum sp.]MDR3436373.1 HD domain-containing protein [Telmatospirillum sp.]